MQAYQDNQPTFLHPDTPISARIAPPKQSVICKTKDVGNIDIQNFCKRYFPVGVTMFIMHASSLTHKCMCM